MNKKKTGRLLQPGLYTTQLILYLVTFALALSLYGCAARRLTEKPDTTGHWVCDPTADAAVEQGDYAKGLILHQAFLEKQPQNALATYHLGYLFGLKGEHAKEVFCYERAIDLGMDRNDQLFFNLGMALLELDRVAEAEAAFEKALEIAPQSADAHFGMAITMEMTKRYDEAQAALLKVLAIDPSHIHARNMLKGIRNR
jgi:tetratricopeptide (TPR) repeat protein